MTIQRTRTHVPPPQPLTDGGDPGDHAPSELQRQAAAYGDIARQALEDCRQGLTADEALLRRRNRSGQ